MKLVRGALDKASRVDAIFLAGGGGAEARILEAMALRFDHTKTLLYPSLSAGTGLGPLVEKLVRIAHRGWR